jgi:DNA-binding PadR family transcriptional regulator
METPKIKLTDSFKITVLICYLLNELGSLTEYQLTKILALDETVNHFDLTEAFGVLEKKGLANFVEKKNERYYEINSGGRTVAAEAGSVPFSVRENSLREGKRILAEIELKKTVSWKVQKRDKGYAFNIRLLNEFGGPDLMEINLYAPSEEGALDIQRRFLERPLDIVRKVMTMFISDMNRL